MPIRVCNPILPGFHPDPSICRVGDDFYIATSSFEYFPGVPIYHSRNLQNWELVRHVLTRRSQLNMLGNPPSGGIWAPDLSYCDGIFYCIFTDVKDWAGPANGLANGTKDTHNYLVTAPKIDGPWSEPVYLNSSGFDPSLFHDDDGRKWFLNMLWDYRPGRNSFAGILLQEYNPQEQKLVGPIRNIFKGSELGVTEAPHLYKRSEWYYLMTAEGGTSYLHAVTLARSRNLFGPYELHPQTHLLTAVADYKGFRNYLKARAGAEADPQKKLGEELIPEPSASAQAEALTTGMRSFLHPGLQKAGHGSMVAWTDTEWVLAHLCGRPIDNSGRCPLGRETAIQKIIWKKDEWPYLQGRGASLEVEFSDPKGVALVPNPSVDKAEYWEENFEGETWSPLLKTLRIPAEEGFALKERPGWLRIRGAESIVSRFRQSILVRPVQHFAWSAETTIDFNPQSFQQMAGLIIRYDESTQVFLRISMTCGRRALGIIHFDLNRMTLPVAELPLSQQSSAVSLGVDVEKRDLQFRWRQGDTDWSAIGPVFDASIMSDDYVRPMGFTGTHVGLACVDLSGANLYADFDYLRYKGKLPEARVRGE